MSLLPMAGCVHSTHEEFLDTEHFLVELSCHDSRLPKGSLKLPFWWILSGFPELEGEFCKSGRFHCDESRRLTRDSDKICQVGIF